MPQRRKIYVVMLYSSVSKLLHEFHLESGRQDKNEEKLVIRIATRLIWSDITSLILTESGTWTPLHIAV